jgi:hypothetical protein
MNPLYRDLLVGFMDDCAYTVGAGKWTAYAVITAMLAVAGNNIIPFGDIIFGLMTLNLVVFAVLSVAWNRVWRQRYVSDLARYTISEREGRQ